MTTKSSPGSSFQLRTLELCLQSSAPGKNGSCSLALGYWNSPAAHTTYRACIVSFLSGPMASPKTSLSRVRTCTSKPPSTGSIRSTSVLQLTDSRAAEASSFRYSAYCTPDGCCVWSVYAGDVP